MEKIKKYKWWQYGCVAIAAAALVVSVWGGRTDLSVIFAAILTLWVVPVFMVK